MSNIQKTNSGAIHFGAYWYSILTNECKCKCLSVFGTHLISHEKDTVADSKS